MNALLETALKYHKRGFHILPITGKRSARCCGAWGELNETESDIQRWFNDTLVTGIGLRLPGLVAIDIDTYNGQKVGSLLDGAGAVLAGRGVTSVWKLPRGLKLKTNDKKSDCEIKVGLGSYVLVPPSIHPVTGKVYEWQEGTGPWDAVELPPAMVARLKTMRGGPASSRHVQLQQLAVEFRKSGKNEAEILKGLESSLCDMPDKARVIPHTELESLAKWAFEKVNNIKVSQLALRKAFIKLYKSRLYWITDVGRECWMAWNDHYWEEYGKGHIRSLALKCVNFVREVTGESKYSTNWTDCLLRDAIGETDFHIREGVFDMKPKYLNCKNVTWGPNGTHEQRAGDYIRYIVDVNYIPKRIENLPDSKWGQFLRDTCTSGGALDTDLLAWLQLAVGYSIFGTNKEQVLFFVHGLPNTGKSTFLEAIRSVLGDYATVIRTQALLKQRWGQVNTPDIAAIVGKRFVVGAEFPKQGKLDEAQLKNLTGNEEICAMAKYKGPITFIPEAKFWFSMNDLPAFSYDDPGVKKRIRVVPFENVVPPGKLDVGLREFFRFDEFEREIILAWIIEGAQRYLECEQLIEPECVASATNAYFEKQDDLGVCLQECFDFETALQVTARDAVECVKLYTHVNQLIPLSATVIGRRLKEMGIEKKKLSNGVMYLGIGLKAELF